MTVLVIASHSGGHVSPAAAFAHALQEKKPGTKIVFVTTDGKAEAGFVDKSFEIHFFKREKISVFSAYKLVLLFVQAQSLMKQCTPDLVAGFGGYLSIPFIMAARLKGIPVFIHEQNVRLGRANSFLAPFVDRIICSFPAADSQKSLFAAKRAVMGLPLRKNMRVVEREAARRYFGFDSRHFVLFVSGGSQGSQAINNIVLEALKGSDNPGISIIHSTGHRDYERLLHAYETIPMEKRIMPFIEHVEYAMSACDCMIARAGAGTIAEIIALGVPSLLIPYPYAGGHQLDNARFLSERKAAFLVRQEECTPAFMKNFLADIIGKPQQLEQCRQALASIGTIDAQEKMADYACQLGGAQ